MTTAEAPKDTNEATFSPEAAREALPPLHWKNPQPPTGELLAYARFYGINFGETMEAVQHAIGHFRAARHDIAAHIWRPERPAGTVLICHGYFDHVGLYKHIIGYLLELGYAVVAYDLPGHGLSSGAPVTINTFRTYRRVLKRCLKEMDGRLPQPWHLVAQSTGGAIAMDLLLYSKGEASPFDQVVLLAPLVRPAKWWYVRLLHTLISPFMRYVKRVFSANSGDPEFLDFIEFRDPLQYRQISSRWVGALRRWVGRFRRATPADVSPVVIQGDQDETVDWRHNLKVIGKKFASPEVHILKGARHHLANESESYRESIRQVLRDHLSGRGPDDR